LIEIVNGAIINNLDLVFNFINPAPVGILKIEKRAYPAIGFILICLKADLTLTIGKATVLKRSLACGIC
jgi:hypothetical protein